MIMRIRLALALALLSSAAFAQSGSPVKQSGNVTPGHATSWTTNGIIQDAGTAANGFLSSIGVVGQGQTICQRTAAITAPAYQQLCWNLTDASGVQLVIQNFGADTPQPFSIVLNGTTYQFPYTVGGIVGPVTTTIGHLAIWNNATGSLLADANAINDQSTLLPSAGDANSAYAAFFNPCVNASAYPCTGGLPSIGVVDNLNRVKIGEAALSSSDFLASGLPSTPSWLDTLFNQAIVGASQLASGAALGTVGITGYARTSDYYNYAGSASLGSLGGVFVGYNDDIHGTNPIGGGLLLIGVQHSGGTGLTTFASQLDINAATQIDITPNAQANGETIGALITPGAYPALATANPSAAINIAAGGASQFFRKGIVVSATALDTTVGAGGGGLVADLPRNASIRWTNSGNTTDAEIWGNASGLNVAGTITSTSGHNLLLNAPTSQLVEFTVNNVGIAGVGAANLYPIADNTTALGATAFRWSAVYAMGYFVGGGNTPGVNCSGSPTSGFTASLGIVTHC